MRRSFSGLPLLLVSVSLSAGLSRPAAAQFTPNHPVANAFQREELIRQQAEFAHHESWEQRRQQFEEHAYENSARFAAFRDGQRAAGDRSGSGRGRMSNLVFRASTLDLPLIAVTSRGVPPAHVDPASERPIIVARRTPLRLTFVSPDAGAKEPMRVEVAFTAADGTSIAQLSGGLITDEEGVVRIDLPAVPPGSYALHLTTTSLGAMKATSHTADQVIEVPAQ